MNEKRDGKRWIWPTTFFILNLAALAIWFACCAGAMSELTVTAMTPSGGEIDNGKVSEVNILFSRPLDPQTIKPDSIRFVPPLPGRTELAGENRLRFLPREPLRAATNYTVIVSPGIRGARGEMPQGDLLEFSTSGFGLESIAWFSYNRNSCTIEMELGQPAAVPGPDSTCAMKSQPPALGTSPALFSGKAGDGEHPFVRLAANRRARPSETQRGKPYANGYEVFLSVERGVYCSGETVLLAGLVRDEEVAVVADLPLEFALLNPDRQEIRRIPARSDDFGRIAFETGLGESFPGGIYTIEARLPGKQGALGIAMFRITEYLPENLSVATELKEPQKDDNDDKRLWIKVSRLAGGETANLPINVVVDYRPENFRPEGWQNWSFGDSRRSDSSKRRQYTARLGSDGTGEVSWKMPAMNFPAATRMSVTVKASENDGRVSTAMTGEVIHNTSFYVGKYFRNKKHQPGSVNTRAHSHGQFQTFTQQIHVPIIKGNSNLDKPEKTAAPIIPHQPAT